MSDKEKRFQPGDIIRIARPVENRFAVYQVTGVYLGGLNQENLIGLTVLDILSGDANGKRIDEMLVPENVLRVAR